MLGAFGRGMSRDEAIDGCLGEAIESYSLVQRGDEMVRVASLADLGSAAIDPREVLLYSESQYDQREYWNRNASPRHSVPERFDPQKPSQWIRGVNLATQQPAWLPAACCLAEYQFLRGEPRFAVSCASGCASGSSDQEARVSAIFELIERDSSAIWWYNQIPRSGVNLESFECGDILRVQDALEDLGRKIWLLDLTTDLNIPSYVAVSSNRSGEEVVFGMAAHTSAQVAALKAITEVSQFWLCSRTVRMPEDVVRWMRVRIEDHPHLLPCREVEWSVRTAPKSCKEQVDLCLHQLAASGLNPFVVDLSRPDVSLRTFRAIVPGLRHVGNRRGPGRLYDVPVRMGALARPKLEAELNPVCCPF
jgi:ribosomal protein S12 methylthiotransferase accessory factor